jgi:hypothetical protein
VNIQLPFAIGLCTAVAFWALPAGSASASQLIYQPNSPAMGGSPFIDDFLLGTADRQNKHREEGAGFPDIRFPDIIIGFPDVDPDADEDNQQ